MTISCRINSSTVLDDNIATWTSISATTTVVSYRNSPSGTQNMTTQNEWLKKTIIEFEFYHICRQIMTIYCRINSSTVLDDNIWTLGRRSRLLRQSSAIEIRRQGSQNMTTRKRVTEKTIVRIRILRLLSSNYDDICRINSSTVLDDNICTLGRNLAATTVVSYRIRRQGRKHDDSERVTEKNDHKNSNFTTFVVKLWRYLVG